MNSEQFKDLVHRYVAGTFSAADKALLAALLEDPQYRQVLADMMDRELAAKAAGEYDHPEVVDRIRTAIAERMAEGTEQEAPAPARRVLPLRRYRLGAAIAATVALLLGGMLLARLFNGKEQQPVVKQASPAPTVTPGSNKAVLTLADGSTLTLDSAGNRVIQQGGATARQQGGQLQYTAHAGAAALRYNTLSTPHGGQFRLTLPDGTGVWLNAGSSLRFPTAFTGRERKVELSGEAYFEVAGHAHMPFTVMVKDMEIAVLGTHFNVMAYADEAHIRTTLLEGAVKVRHGQQAVTLRPGQQALLRGNTGALHVSPGDTEGAIAWKNGYFKFSNEDIQSVMRRVSRWYNVTVEYQGDFGGRAIWGTVSRFGDISDVLQMLELTGAVHFEMKGRRITVYPGARTGSR
ncbi:FecR family protein [Chitinophaga japonensis]|uniref:FecR family protein n=1 Tax=Chitinophaga japonensis TaxID=104662 RepID=A0A562TD36_CHIJA|nr:FecR family protein [Chitinophaga japonensis]TWI90986.1 FecR family protein [Chitinophaga japonensis]